MAEQYRGGYRGAKFPSPLHWVDAYGGAVAGAFNGHAAVQDSLREEFDRAVTAIKADVDLSSSGKSKALAKLADKYRAHPTIKKLETDLATLRKEEAALRARLTNRPSPDLDKLSPYQAVSLAMAEGRTIARFEALSPEQRREAVRVALDKQDNKFLALVLREPALLPDAIARRIEGELARTSDPDAYRQLQHLVGPINFDGVADPIGGVIPVAAQGLDIFLTHVDEAVGLEPGARERATAVEAATRKDAVVITAEQGHDVAFFRMASARAQERNLPLRIEGPAGEGEVSPGELAPIGPNGSGGQGGA